MTTGFVLGKFMPLHKGHENMINFALKMVDDLYIIVDNFENDSIGADIRHKILCEAYGANAKIILLPEKTPQHPDDHPDFMNYWANLLIAEIGHKPDYMIGSMDYVIDLANAMGINYIMHDVDRHTVPVSATMIRDDPHKYYNLLSDYSKPLFVKKIFMSGPESTGKSTAARKLAKRLNATLVREYGSLRVQERGESFCRQDIDIVLQAHSAIIEEATKETQNGIVVIDSDAITTGIWAEKLFDYHPSQLDHYIEKHQYDYYFLFDHKNIPWVQDGTRFYPRYQDREWFFHKFKQQLKRHQISYTVISHPDDLDKFCP